MSTLTATAPPEQITYPAAGLDRRFYAFALDRLLVWGLYAVTVYLAYRHFLSEDNVGAGVGVIAGVVLGLGLVHAVLLGVAGLSLGKLVAGLRVVGAETGAPIGVGPALLRTLVLGVAGLPTFTFGVASLAWTAVMDPGGRRRGWHDQVAGSVVVDVRPVPEEDAAEPERPRQIVNLTAMRLMPVPPPEPTPAPPPRAPRPVTPARATPAQPPAQAPTQPPAAPVPAPASSFAPSVPPPTPRSAPPPPRRAAPSGPPAGAPAHRGGATQPPATAPPAPPRRTPAPPATPTPPAPASPAPAAVGGAHAAPAAPAGPAARWRVTFDTGETFEMAGLALVGRRPEARGGEQVAHLVPLRSSDMSLSKTHAQFQVVPDGALVVMDRGSTNGSVLLRKGVAKPLTAGRPATLVDGDTVRFGDREMRVERLG